MSETAWNTFAGLSILAGIALYMHQSILIFRLAKKSVSYSDYVPRAWKARFGALLLLSGGVLLLLFPVEHAEFTAEMLLFGGAVNLLCAVINAVRVGTAVRRARKEIAEREAEGNTAA